VCVCEKLIYIYSSRRPLCVRRAAAAVALIKHGALSVEIDSVAYAAE